jgi:membrane-bound lytic murein transglycosylase B
VTTTRRAFVLSSLALCAPALAQEQGFARFLETLWPQAQAAGVSRAVFETLLALTPDKSLMGTGTRQAEFERTIQQYLESAVNSARVKKGQDLAQQWRTQLSRIEAQSGVPASIILAAWGMETDYGRAHGERDVLRSLATLAFARRDNPVFAREVVAALVLLQRGLVPRERLKGSWAGAMGHPQFMPSAYLNYAVSFDGKGAPDIWGNIPDALASIGNFLKQEGWQKGLPWGIAVDVPGGFAWDALSDSARNFAAKGVKSSLPADAKVSLFAPAGAQGPAFLITQNFFVLKQYNNSDSYALSLSVLSERIDGRPAITKSWPKEFRILERPDRVKLQQALTRHGFYEGKIDGRFGPSSREAIHRFQKAAGLHPADGFASKRVLDAALAYR